MRVTAQPYERIQHRPAQHDARVALTELLEQPRFGSFVLGGAGERGIHQNVRVDQYHSRLRSIRRSSSSAARTADVSLISTNGAPGCSGSGGAVREGALAEPRRTSL